MVMAVVMIMIVLMAATMIMAVIVVVTAFMVVIVVMLFEERFRTLGESLLSGAVDLADGDSALGSDLRARFKFWRKQRAFAVTPAEFAVQLADRCLDDTRLSSTFRALHQRTTDAERRRLGEDDVLHLVHVGRSAENAQQHAGPILFHLDRGREDFDRTRIKQLLFRVTDDLRRDVVQIGFELNDLVGLRQRRALANEQAKQVSTIGEVTAAGSVADRFNSHRWQRRVSRDECSQNRCAGWRGQFGFDGQIDQRDALEQLGCAGGGYRADAVSDLDAATPRWNRTRDDFINAEQIKSDRRADDVYDRVNRSDFVEMNLVDCRAMHAGLCLGNVLEDFESKLLLRLSQLFGTVDQLGDVGEVPVSVLFGVLDFDLQCSEAPFDDRLDMQFDVWQAERINAANDRLEIGSSVDQGRQGHITTDAATALEVRNPHDKILVDKGQSEGGRILVVVPCPTNGS